MANPTPSPLAVRLRTARERLGLTQQGVAERASLGTSSLSDFESGKRAPSIAQLRLLAGVYSRSVEWFLRETPSQDEVVVWRERPENEIAAEVEARFLNLCEQFTNLEQWAGEVRDTSLPRPAGTAASFIYSDAEKLAYDFRNAYGLGERPGSELLRVLEEVCRVKVFHLDVQPSGTAASSVGELFGAAILLNCNNVPWRRTYDLAHELFHLLTWELFSSTWAGSPRLASEKEEKLATCFARHLLMPAEVFRIEAEGRKKADGRLTPDDHFALARQFDVSADAVAWHWGFLTRRSDEEIKSDVAQCQALRPLLEIRPRDTPPLRPMRFCDLAEAALRSGSISIGRFAEYTGVSRADALLIAEQQADNAREAELPAAPGCEHSL